MSIYSSFLFNTCSDLALTVPSQGHEEEISQGLCLQGSHKLSSLHFSDECHTEICWKFSAFPDHLTSCLLCVFLLVYHGIVLEAVGEKWGGCKPELRCQLSYSYSELLRVPSTFLLASQKNVLSKHISEAD